MGRGERAFDKAPSNHSLVSLDSRILVKKIMALLKDRHTGLVNPRVPMLKKNANMA